MKKVTQMFIVVFVAAFALMYLTSYLNARHGYSGADTLTIYNWGDYIDPDLIVEFERETGLKIIYQTFDSNEAMLTKISHGGTTFDVVIPSDYAISKMKEQGLLIPLDHSKLPNAKYIDPRFLDMPFDDENEYSIPYFWGTYGIIYNPEIISDIEFTSWNDLWDPSLRNEILLIDSAREVIGLGLNSLCYSLNETDIGRLRESKQKLDKLTPNVKAIVGDEIKMLLANEEAAVGVVWSGDASEIIGENDKLDYVIPEEGSNVWLDNMVIPKTAKNVEGAHLFINFMLDPENAARNTEYVGYSTPNTKALEYLPEEITGDERFYPGVGVTDTLEVYENLGRRMTAYYNELFLEFKMHRK
ncbi:MAG: ABC transporter substrate-binding protein [Bacillota bacterium]|jgi:spermidine/putrescine transport system substrate-binding protein